MLLHNLILIYTVFFNLSVYFLSDLIEMECSNATRVDISIPVVGITKSTGEGLNKFLTSGRKGQAFNSYNFYLYYCV